MSGSGAINVLIFLLLGGGMVVGAVFLQIYLSKSKSRLPGLILPIVTFGISLLIILGNMLFMNLGSHTVIENGAIVEQSSSALIGGSAEDGITVIDSYVTSPPGAIVSNIIIMSIVFLLYNIPTGILLAIYFATRSKIKKDSSIEKMSVQDIE